MKKCLLGLLFAFLFITPSFAEENNGEEYEEVELNAFGFPDKSFVKLIDNSAIIPQKSIREKPACNNKLLTEKAKQTARPFVNTNMTTIIDKRRNILITKNIDNFVDLSIDDASKMDNRVVKARLTELKINNRLTDKNIKICQSNNSILVNSLFILMYDDKNNVKVEILNLAVGEIPTFYFYDK